MGLSYKKRISLGNGIYANISKSGVSISQKVGNVTVNSRGGTTVNLGNGAVWRSQKKNKNSKGQKSNQGMNPANDFMGFMMMQQMMQQMMDNTTDKSKKSKK